MGVKRDVFLWGDRRAERMEESAGQRDRSMHIHRTIRGIGRGEMVAEGRGKFGEKAS